MNNCITHSALGILEETKGDMVVEKGQSDSIRK